MGLTIRFQIRKHRCTPGALRESQAHQTLKGSPNSQAFQTSHLPRGCQDTKHAPWPWSLEEPVPGWSPLCTPRPRPGSGLSLCLLLSPHNQQVWREGAGTRAERYRPLFIHKLCCYQLSTDHTTEAEGKPATEVLSLPCELPSLQGSVHAPPDLAPSPRDLAPSVLERLPGKQPPAWLRVTHPTAPSEKPPHLPPFILSGPKNCRLHAPECPPGT